LWKSPLFAVFVIVAIPDKRSVSKPISVSHKEPSYKYEAIENRLDDLEGFGLRSVLLWRNSLSLVPRPEKVWVGVDVQ